MTTLDELFQEARREDPSPLTTIQRLNLEAKEEIAKALNEHRIPLSVASNFLCILRQENLNRPAVFEIFLAECLKEMGHDNPETLHILAECMGDHPIATWAKQKLEKFLIEEKP